jgi:hypothetical protein
MKKLTTLGFCLFFLSTSFAQKLDYDRDSKWFFGINAGGTWHTTDVKNKTHLGWGLILGRSFNYNYGKKVSFDLRLRYLGGNWYGQDYDTTNVTGNSLYYPDGEVAQRYDTLGYTINNFNNEAHELGLEFVLHINSLREKTGWDPYIFGGAGIAWNQSQGDLYSQDILDTLNNSYYQYAANGISKAELNQLSDDIYDTPLDGHIDGYTISFVPNVGIGLAYQVGPKFSIGLEHRTMFYLKNTFDGYAGNSTKWGMENDLYHYSGLLMKFNIGKKKTGTDVTPNDVTETDCLEPKINLRKPSQRTSTVEATDYTFEAIIKNIAGRNNIQFSVNGSMSTNFTYDVSSGKFESKILLQPGANQIVLKASNACGTDEEKVTINYVDCVKPVVNFTNPASNSISVDQASFVVNAIVTNADNIEYQVNGMNSSNYVYSSNNFSSTITLREGENTIRIIARNACGSDQKVVKVNFTNCATPFVRLTSGTGTITVSEPVYSFRAEVGNVQSKQNIQFLVNGVNKSFTYNLQTKAFQSSVALNPGANTLQIAASNDCGNDTEVLTVEYAPCVQPVVSFTQPAGSNITVNTSTQVVKALIQGVSSSSQVQMKVNGIARMGGTYNATTKVFEQTVSLREGENTVEIKATNACGSDTKTTKITKRPCVGPQLIMVQPSTQVSSVESNAFTLKTMVSNVSSASQIKLFLNGVSILGGTYSTGTNIFQKSLTLRQGSNTIKVVATNDCSSEELIYTITYTPCVAPNVTMTSPASPTIVANTSMVVQARVTNVSSASQIQLTLNGLTITGGTYNAATKMFTKTVNLVQGSNSIVVKGTNACGTDQASVTATYRPCVEAAISMIAPSGSSTNVDNASYTVKATISNVASVNQVQLKVNGLTIGGGTLNNSSHLFEKSITLNQGANTITITASNDCGSKTETFVINFTPCLVPAVTIVSPTGRKITTDQSSILIKAKVLNVQQASEIKLMLNGKLVAGGTYNSGTNMFQQTVNLGTGSNKINVIGKTDCGQSFASVTVNYQPCVAPTLTMIAPTTSSVESPMGTYLVKASVQNASSASQISLTINGSVVTGGTFNSGTGIYEHNIVVHDAISTVVVKVTTDCGEASKTFIVKHSPCLAPTMVLITQSPLNVTTATTTIQATIMNVTSANQVSLRVNGVVVTGGTLNVATGLFQKTVNVNVGVNDVKLKAVTDCGQVQKLLTITRAEANSQEDPGSGTGIGIGGSGTGGTGGTVTGGGSDPDPVVPPGDEGGEGGEKSGEDDKGKPGVKPKNTKPKEGEEEESGKKKGGK